MAGNGMVAFMFFMQGEPRSAFSAFPTGLIPASFVNSSQDDFGMVAPTFALSSVGSMDMAASMRSPLGGNC